MPDPAQELLDPATLHFDRENPRFAQHRYTTDEQIVRELYDQADVGELLQSILTGGYIDFEPLVVLRQGSIVLEGNRRLAALRLICDEQLRGRLKISLPKIDSPKPPPVQIRALVVEAREQARSFIGFKHINGPSSGTPWRRPNMPQRGVSREAPLMRSAAPWGIITTRCGGWCMATSCCNRLKRKASK